MALRKPSNIVTRLTSKTGIIILFLLSHGVLLFMMTLTFPRINSRLGTEAFDLKPLGYSVTEAREMLGNLDAPTVQIYLFPQLFLLDILYPLLLALLLSALIIRLSRITRKDKTFLFLTAPFLPFVAMIFDYLENTMIALMITNPVHTTSGLIKTASTFTILKSVATTLSWLLVIILLGLWLYAALIRRKRRFTDH